MGDFWKEESVVRNTMGNSSAMGNSTASMQKKTSAVDRRTDASKDCGPLPTLLSSNRQVERQRELAKSWYNEQQKINDAMGSSALSKARMKTSNDRLAAYVDSSTSIHGDAHEFRILGPVKRSSNSWAK